MASGTVESVPGVLESSASLKPITLTASGVVLDAATGAALPGAKIYVVQFGHSEPSAHSGDQGEYTLQEEVFAREYNVPHLACDAPGYARQTRALEDLPAGVSSHTIRADFQLHPGASLSGRVLSVENSAPLANIAVYLNPRIHAFEDFADARSNEMRAQTDAEGRYSITSVPSGTFHVYAVGETSNHILAAGEIPLLQFSPGDQHVQDFKMESGAVLTGSIRLPAGTPTEESVVFVHVEPLSEGPYFTQHLHGHLSAVVEEDRYEVQGLRYGEAYVARVEADGLGNLQSEPFTIERGESPRRLDFSLSRGSTVRGKIQRQDGSPVADIEVYARREDAGVGFSNIEAETTSDPEGNFQLMHLGPGIYELDTFEAISFEPLRVELDGTQELQGVLLVVEEDMRGDGDGEIRGRVLDAAGRPVAEAEVEAEAEFDWNSATTDADGVFVLDRLGEQSYTITAKHKTGEGRLEAVAPGADITLELGPVTRISGLVMDAEGQPVSGCRVRLRKEGGGAEDPSILFLEEMMISDNGGARTNEFGFFELLHAPAGAYRVQALAPGKGGGRSEVFSVEPHAQISLNITLEPGVRFAGRVTNTQGTPVSGAEILMYDEADTGLGEAFGPPGALANLGLPPTVEAISGTDGTFAMQGVPAGSYLLRARKSGLAPSTLPGVVLSPGEDKEGFLIRMNAGGCVRGTFLLEGEPQAGWQVNLMGEDFSEDMRTDPSGRFEYCGLPPGTYVVMINDPDYSIHRHRSAVVVEGQTTVVDFSPPPNAVAIEGMLSGVGDGMANVSLRPPGSPAPFETTLHTVRGMMEAMQHLVSTAEVAEDGSFSLHEVPPGNYVLEVYYLTEELLRESMDCCDEPVITQEITVQAGEQPRLELSLPSE